MARRRHHVVIGSALRSGVRRTLPLGNAVSVGVVGARVPISFRKPVVISGRRKLATVAFVSAPIVPRRASYAALLGSMSPKQPIKIRKLCKCSSARSERQRLASRRFFAGYGGRGTPDKRIRACEC